MPSGPVTPFTTASGWGTWVYETTELSTGWLKKGGNTIAVEVHNVAGHFGQDTYFNLNIEGRRELATCHSESTS